MSLTSPDDLPRERTNLLPGGWRAAADFTDPRGAAPAALTGYPQREWGAAPHAAAALAWKAYAWWVVAPVVDALRLDRPVPPLSLRNTEVALLGEQPYLRFRVLDPTPITGYDVLEQVRADIVEGHLGRVAAALSAATRVGVRTLWGSVAESVSYPLLTAGRADLAGRLLRAWSLDTLLDPPAGDGQPLRRTCCLAVTVPGLGVCPTCPVNRRSSQRSPSMAARSG